MADRYYDMAVARLTTTYYTIIVYMIQMPYSFADKEITKKNFLAYQSLLKANFTSFSEDLKLPNDATQWPMTRNISLHSRFR